MTNLVIDIGNTHTKVAVFIDKKLDQINYYEQFTLQHLAMWLRDYAVSHSIISAVNAQHVESFEQLLKTATQYTRFSVNATNTIDNRYKSPETLGLDRLAAIIGAQALYPNTDCLVIDAGTCITYDAVDSKGAYRGGSISPGLHMRLKALNAFTARLPLVDLDVNFAEWEGNDTRTSILSGVMQGAILELQGFIQMYHDRHPQLKVILCGGDAFFFDTRLKNTIFAHLLNIESNLVLIGLNEVIYQQNA